MGQAISTVGKDKIYAPSVDKKLQTDLEKHSEGDELRIVQRANRIEADLARKLKAQEVEAETLLKKTLDAALQPLAKSDKETPFHARVADLLASIEVNSSRADPTEQQLAAKKKLEQCLKKNTDRPFNCMEELDAFAKALGK